MGYIDKIASSFANYLVAVWQQISWIFTTDTIKMKPLLFLDIILVAFVFYWIYIFLKKTTASRFLPGFLAFSVFAGLGYLFDLNAVAWLFSKMFLVIIVAIPIIFQPEIREALSLMSKKKSLVNAPINKEDRWST